MDAFIVAALGALGGMAAIAWRSRRHAQTGDFDCALRPVGSKSWEHGRARVAPGELSFRRTAGLGGVRLGVKPSPPRSIAVALVNPHDRRPTGREAWGVNPS